MKTKNTLLIITAYMLMIIIWSTTPLAIKWSSQGVDYITGLSARMIIGAFLATMLALLWHQNIPLHKEARQVCWASSLAIYGAMMMVYWGAQYIPSGLVSVIYGLTPIFTAGFALYLLTNESLDVSKFLGALMAVLGLAIFVLFAEPLPAYLPSTVALATLVTPITALLLGKWLNQETITLYIFLGSALVMTGLVIHQWYDKLIQKMTSRA